MSLDPIVIPEPTASRTYRRSVIVSWVVILLSVGVIVTAVNIVPVVRGTKRANADAAATENIELRSAARMAVGAKAITHGLGQLDGSKETRTVATRASASQVDAIDRVVKEPADKLRGAVVAGEVDGGAAALARLEKLEVPQDQSELRADKESLEKIYSGHGEQLDDSARQALIERHGWFGKLALAYGKPDSDPQRSDAIRPAIRAAITLYIVGISVLVGLLAGLILLIVGIIVVATGRLRMWFAPVSPPVPRAVFLEAFALYVFLFIVAFSLAIRLVVKSPGISWSMLATVLLPFALWWPVRRGTTWQESRLGFGWHLGPGVGGFRVVREIALGVVGYLAGLPLIAAALICSVMLSRWVGVSPTHPIMKDMSSGGWRLSMIYLLACVWAPVMEETMFRGALFNHLRTWHRWPLSAVTVGVLFAAVHPQGWTLIPGLGMIGVVLAGIREWRAGILASMTAHALNNFVVVTIVSSLVAK